MQIRDRLLAKILTMTAKKKATKKVATKKTSSTPRYTVITKVVDKVRGTTTIKRESVDKV